MSLGGLPWWRSGWESACQCRGHGFEPWSGKIPHAAEQLGPWATITEPVRLEPVLCDKRGRDGERPAHRDEEWPPLAASRESPRTETKTQHSQKFKKKKKKKRSLGDFVDLLGGVVSYNPVTFQLGCWKSTQFQWLSKCGIRTCSIRTIWELVRNASSQPHPRSTESGTVGWDPAICFNKPWRWLWCWLKFENHCSCVIIK